jgi:hypothetical protein
VHSFGELDLKALKLELLERIANLEDEARLLALKRLLDGPPSYAAPGEHLSVVREGEASYLKLEDRMYTAAEVRALVQVHRCSPWPLCVRVTKSAPS